MDWKQGYGDPAAWTQEVGFIVMRAFASGEAVRRPMADSVCGSSKSEARLSLCIESAA